MISYVFPVTRKIESGYNGRLELTLLNGRTLLNTVNTNYSYGSLQRVLRFALKQIPLSGDEKVLVLGLGGGSVLKTLRNEMAHRGVIMAVEIDPVMIRLAASEFNVMADDSTAIFCDDAFTFVQQTTEKFDLLIVDLFIDNRIPEQFLGMAFWSQAVQRVCPGGHIIFNTLCLPPTDIRPVIELLTAAGFQARTFRHVEGSNKVLIAGFLPTAKSAQSN